MLEANNSVVLETSNMEQAIDDFENWAGIRPLMAVSYYDMDLHFLKVCPASLLDNLCQSTTLYTYKKGNGLWLRQRKRSQTTVMSMKWLLFFFCGLSGWCSYPIRCSLGWCASCSRSNCKCGKFGTGRSRSWFILPYRHKILDGVVDF